MDGLDTGFFCALQEQHPMAVEVWHAGRAATSVLVLFELERLGLKGQLQDWPNTMATIASLVRVAPVMRDGAQRASRIAHGTGMPAMDALILASLLEAGCDRVFTVDPHMTRYAVQGLTVHNPAATKTG